MPVVSSDHTKHSPRHLPLVHRVDPVSSPERHTTESLLLYVVYYQLHEISIDVPLLGRVDAPAEITNLDFPLHS
jgi:hypothetical protein